MWSPDRVLERSQVVPVDIEEAFAFFADAWNLEAITPAWLRFRIIEAPRTLGKGSLLVYRLRIFGVPISGGQRSSSGGPRSASLMCSCPARTAAGSIRTGSARSMGAPRSTTTSFTGSPTSRLRVSSHRSRCVRG